MKTKFEIEDEDIKRCLENLYSTVEGTQPLDRKFGLSNSYIDYPMQVAQNVLAMEIIEKTSIYEPRVEVTSVEFDSDLDTGLLIPIIHLERVVVEDED